MWLINTLKPLFQGSRPFFDDISLADMSINDCSAEFGNPSAHSILACHCIFTWLWFLYDFYPEYFRRNKMVMTALNWFTYSFIAGVMYSRVYVGRHTFDQVITGALVGTLGAHFTHYYYRTQILDQSVRPDMTREESWNQWYKALHLWFWVTVL